MKRLQCRWMLVCALLWGAAAMAQGPSFHLRLALTFGGKPLLLEQPLQLGVDTVHIEALKFYISHLELLEGDRSLPMKFSPRLIDAEQGSEQVLAATDMAFDRVRFVLGIDSVLQVGGAQGGDLDPVKGMYWAWQSGYVHFKLEGTSTACKARQHRFQYHLGGYIAPHATQQSVTLPVRLVKGVAVVSLPVDELLAQFAPAQVSELMRPCPEAVAYSKVVAQHFQSGK